MSKLVLAKSEVKPRKNGRFSVRFKEVAKKNLFKKSDVQWTEELSGNYLNSNPDDFIDELIELKQDTPIPYVGATFLEMPIMLDIFWNYRKMVCMILKSDSNPSFDLEDEFDVKKYKPIIDKCFKNNKGVAVSVGIPGHANAVYMNPYFKTLEYFEPHGDEGGEGIGFAGDKRKSQSKWKKIAGELGLKYVPPADSCPRITKEQRDRSKVFQMKKGKASKRVTFPEGATKGIQALAKQNKLNLSEVFDGMLISGRTGYCMMFEMLWLEFRIRQPKLPPNELMTRLVQKVKNSFALGDFIKGYAWKFIKRLPYIKNDDLIRYVKIEDLLKDIEDKKSKEYEDLNERRLDLYWNMHESVFKMIEDYVKRNRNNPDTFVIEDRKYKKYRWGKE